MKLTTLQALYVEELKDLYCAENQFLRALPKMASAASAPQLREAFTDHLHQAQVHASRLEKVIERLVVGPKGNDCKPIESLIAKGKELMREEGKSAVMDAALVAAAKRFEHYVVAGYGSARTLARQLGHDKAADLLQMTLDEKADRDQKLTELAETIIGGVILALNGQQ
jgi:ferritin-like metal-binding protein YciE